MFNKVKVFAKKIKKLPRKLKDSFFCFLFVEKLRQFIQSELIDNDGLKREDDMNTVEDEPIRNEEDESILLIAFRPTGGLGDLIVSARFLDVLMSYCKCRVDVYTSSLEYGKAIYSARQGVNVRLWDSFRYNTLEGTFCNNKNYDLVITAEHFLRIHYYYLPRLEKIAPELTDRIFEIKKGFEQYYPHTGERNFTESLHIHKCEIQGINRYTTLEHNRVFDIPDKFTYIALNEAYLEEISKTGLKNRKYITINRGADNMGGGNIQTKVWSMNKYEELVKQIKKTYPELEIVQIGGKNNELIRGTDQKIMGKSLELTKWVLQNSLLHIDCEGGLVHLSTQLGTKCVVLFGPTSISYYGYEENINIKSEVCGNCMGRTRDWAYKCGKEGSTNVPCMDAIDVHDVFEKISNEINDNSKKMYFLTHASYEELSSIAIKSKGKKIAFINFKDLGYIDLFSDNNDIAIFNKNYSDGTDSNGLLSEWSKKYDVRLGDENDIPYQKNSFDMVIYVPQVLLHDVPKALMRIAKENAQIIYLDKGNDENEQNKDVILS